jgi:N-methylhydantoinase B
VLVDASRLSVLAEKAVLPPFGVCGGAAGATNRFWVLRGEQPIQPSPLPGKVGGFLLQRDDVVLMESSGGGGFGDPLERDLARVAADLAEGYVTREAATRDYGVIWRDGAVDEAATRARRDCLRAARPRVRLHPVRDLDADRGRLVRLDATTAARLGVGAGAIVELVNPRGAPLRAWVAAVLPGNGERAEIAAAAVAMLALPADALVELRAVHSGSLGTVGTMDAPGGSPWPGPSERRQG